MFKNNFGSHYYHSFLPFFFLAPFFEYLLESSTTSTFISNTFGFHPEGSFTSPNPKGGAENTVTGTITFLFKNNYLLNNKINYGVFPQQPKIASNGALTFKVYLHFIKPPLHDGSKSPSLSLSANSNFLALSPTASSFPLIPS